jgi:antitoxin ParD1/3/4
MATITIPDEQAATLEQMVRSGLYPDIASIIEEAIERSFEHEMEHHSRVQMLREAIALGDADIEAGRYATFNSREEVAAYFEARRNAVRKAAE